LFLSAKTCNFADSSLYFNHIAIFIALNAVRNLLSLFQTKLLSILLISIVAIAVVGCGKEKERSYRIGVAQCSADPWRWETNDEIERELMFHDNVTVETRSADDIDEKQIADIEYFIDNDFDLIIVNPTRADAVTPVIKKAFDKGIPIVTFDRRILGDSYTAHLEVDNTGIGKEAGEYAISMFPNGAKIIEIQGDNGMTPTIGRHRGFAQVIAAHPNQQILASVYGKWNPDTTAHLVDSLLTVHPDADLIYCHSDAMAISASRTARSRGFNNIKILGIDGMASEGIKAVADSTIDATFLYPTYGYRLIRTAIDILEGRPYQRETIIPPVSAIDRHNADIMLQQNTMMKEETSKILGMKDMLDIFWGRYYTQKALLYSLLVIAILLFGVMFLLLRMFRQRGNHQKTLMEKNRQLEQERDKQKVLYDRLDQATKSKLVFFTNVSHDLRTPLTLIAEPIEQVAAAPYLNQRDRSLMSIARKNVAILRRLIDQILDFRKYENGKLELNLTEANYRQLFADWIEDFSQAAQNKDISLTSDISAAGEPHLAFDVDKIQRVLFNLMSNALKYTPANGKIHFACSCNETALTFSVSDSGCGISPEEAGKVFERFYQVDKINPNGSGIGLALSKAFVELHGGELTLESTPGRGSRFLVRLPLRHVATPASPASASASATVPDGLSKEAAAKTVPDSAATLPDGAATTVAKAEAEAKISSEAAPLEAAPETLSGRNPLVLAIDDNEDILQMIRLLLGNDYEILTAANGKQGIKLAAKYTPDLIICDVMMPVMDGLECCRILKRELATSHIPVLMLTACSMDAQRVQGYESGADGYISKPFSGDLLKARCKSLLENRRRIYDLYSNPAGIAAPTDKPRPETPELPVAGAMAIDSDFYAEFLRIAAQHMGERDFGVDTVASMMGLGQSQFCRKIKSLTNYTPVELIRNLRLRKARTLLLSSDKSISEIAYEVGFTTPAYFSKCYRDAYGEAPSDLRPKA
jgi:signal transduction histidine kinase/DNA-binding response OmpR family regulator/ABC-type xylose transport system substrate-binding protein